MWWCSHGVCLAAGCCGHSLLPAIPAPQPALLHLSSLCASVTAATACIYVCVWFAVGYGPALCLCMGWWDHHVMSFFCQQLFWLCTFQDWEGGAKRPLGSMSPWLKPNSLHSVFGCAIYIPTVVVCDCGRGAFICNGVIVVGPRL